MNKNYTLFFTTDFNSYSISTRKLISYFIPKQHPFNTSNLTRQNASAFSQSNRELHDNCARHQMWQATTVNSMILLYKKIVETSNKNNCESVRQTPRNKSHTQMHVNHRSPLSNNSLHVNDTKRIPFIFYKYFFMAFVFT